MSPMNNRIDVLPSSGPELIQALHFTLVLSAVLIARSVTSLSAAEETNSPPAQPAVASKAEKPNPLPLHQIEGNGGIFSTLSAYIVNPPRDGEPLGRPSLGFSYVSLGHGQNLEALTLTESPWKRIELGYGWNRLGLGDLPLDIKDATTVSVGPDDVQLHNFNARFQLIKEGEFDQKWLPAITLGSHYKSNETRDDLDHDLGGALKMAGIKDSAGEDVTLYASKLFTQLPRPVLLELGGRATRGVWNGLAGFTDNYSFLFEGNVVVFVTKQIALAAEYRQQPNDYTPIKVGRKTLVGESGDWWTIDAAYVVNKHLTLAAGYGHFGGVLNHEANGVWGLTTKWEF
jgi:hypothetical protein